MSAPARPGPHPLLEWGAYIALAAGAVGPAIRAGHVVGDGVDLYGTFWFYWWVDRCLRTGSDPGFTDLFFYPLGKDIFAHTGNNFLDAVAAWPLQALLPYPGYQPWFVLLLLFVNAVAFRPLARQVHGGDGWAVWASTSLWMVSPFILFECMTGRLTQAFLWFLPGAFLGWLRLCDAVKAGVRWPWKPALLLGVSLALTGWGYWFNAFFVVFCLGWLAVVELWGSAGRRLVLARAWALAGLVALLLVSPAALSMFGRAGDGAVPGLAESAGQGLFDPLPRLGNNVASTLHGLQLMEVSGQPMLGNVVWGGGLLLFMLFGRQRWRWLGVAAVSIAVAIGPELNVPGVGPVPMPHYLLLYRLLPFFDRLWFPYRMIVIALLATAIGLGTLVTRAGQLRGRGGAWLRRLPWLLPLLLLLTTLVEQHRYLAWPLLHRDLTPPPIYAEIGRLGGALIELPIGLSKVAIAWQPVHGQPTFGGMGENATLFWPEGYKKRLSNSFITALRKATRDPGPLAGFNPRDQQRLIDEGFRWVVLDRLLVDSELHRGQGGRRPDAQTLDQAPFVVTRHLTEALGAPAAVDGALVIWDLVGGATLPPALQPTDAGLTTRSWPTEDMPAYEQLLRERGRLPPAGGPPPPPPSP